MNPVVDLDELLAGEEEIQLYDSQLLKTKRDDLNPIAFELLSATRLRSLLEEQGNREQMRSGENFCYYQVRSLAGELQWDTKKMILSPQWGVDAHAMLDAVKKDEKDSFDALQGKKGEEIQPLCEEGFLVRLPGLFELYARVLVRKSLPEGWELEPFVTDRELTQETGKGKGWRSVGSGEFYSSSYIAGRVIPDLVLRKKETVSNTVYVILDVKYKDPTRRGGLNREDRLQLLAYAGLYDAHEIGHIFPPVNGFSQSRYALNVRGRKNQYHYSMIRCTEENIRTFLEKVCQEDQKETP